MTILAGGCLCGQVRYEIDGPLGRMSHCHCSMCRRQHGAAFATYAGVPAERFRFTRGEGSVRRYASSPGVARVFCEHCGSSLQWLSDAQPDRVDIAVGTLDGDPGSRPWAHIYVASKAAWVEIADGLPRFDASSKDASPTGAPPQDASTTAPAGGSTSGPSTGSSA